MKAPHRPHSLQNYSNAQAKGSELSRSILEIEEPRSPLISLVIPAYNEAAILQENLDCIYEHVLQNAQKFRRESVIINDGSKDETGRIAVDFARDKRNVAMIVHYRLCKYPLQCISSTLPTSSRSPLMSIKPFSWPNKQLAYCR
jgi:glycosyltransferase involved in cell wall biosynthesis